VEEAGSITPKEKKVFFETVLKAAEACAKVREDEGTSVQKDLKKHIDLLKKLSVKIEKLRGQTAKDLQKKYQQRLEKLNIPGEVDEQRMAQEVVILIDKSDISEEIQRLKAHLEALTDLIHSDGSIGKKLDFYAQELLREVNTIGSKSTTSELTQFVVEAKGAIEKYREQVQNVE
jgi:uncharacterized protein (TIGR00255 family)